MLDKHDLLHEFPDHHHTIRHLKMNNRRFENLFTEYNELTADIHHIEAQGVPTSDNVLNTKRQNRVQLKDTLWSMIQEEEATQ